jgi:cell shape-determining protein MreD
VITDAGKAAAILFVAVILQVSILSDVHIVHGRPQLLLVTVICVSLLRGAVFGSFAGFAAGFLADTGTFGMLGFTSLLLTLAGYWTGRYGETTGRDRAHAPVLSEHAPAREVLLNGLFPTVVLNILLTLAVYPLVRRVLPHHAWTDRAREVQLLG